MKKRILAAILAMMLVFPVLASCSGKPDPKPDLKPDPPVVSNEIMVANFEQFGPDFQLLRPMNNFGVIEQNDDKAYVKNGEHSARVKPMGGSSKVTEPYFYIPLQSDLFDFDYRDFSKVVKITAWVYNAETTVQKMKLGVITSIPNYATATRMIEVKFDLKAGWNEVIYNVDLGLLQLAADIKDVDGISFAFENAGVMESENAPTLYFDDIKIIKDFELGEIPDIITLDQFEICSFEKAYQNFIISANADNPKCMPDIGVVKASDYSLTAPEGENVFRLLMKPGDAAEATWPEIVIPEKVMQKTDMKNFATLTPDDLAKVSLEFKVYNNGPTDKTIFTQFYSEGGNDWASFAIGAVKGQWTTASIKLTSDGLVEAHFKTPGKLSISWGEFVGSGNYELFFDDFKFVVTK